MQAKALSLSFLGNEGLLKIPFFQRSYVWDEDNWEDLFNELFDGEPSKFLGSIIIKQLESGTGKVKKALIIDGQQRLTTLSILLRSLFNYLPEETQNNCKDDLNKILFFKKKSSSAKHEIKIEHSKVDNYAFDLVMRHTSRENINNRSSSRIIQCFNFFNEKFSQKKPEELINFFDNLVDDDNKILVVIDLSKEDNEQAIFDTINSAGVHLSSADIIKNYLFQKMSELVQDERRVNELYKEYWENIFLSSQEQIDFWETQRVTGRLKRDNIEILLHSVAVIQGFFDSEQLLTNLSKLYKEYIDTLVSKNELEDFLIRISEYAKIFKEKFVIFDKGSILEYSDYSNRVLHILQTCEISTFHPYILQLFYKFKHQEINEVELQDKLYKLECFVIRHMVARLPTKSYSQVCKNVLKDENYLQILSVPDSDLKKYLLDKIKINHAKLLLFWIELYRREHDDKRSIKSLTNNLTLEHIMPKSWEKHWSNIKNENQQEVVTSDAKNERNLKIEYLGNMTLLTQKLNTSLSNNTFDIKINGEPNSRKHGLNFYTELSIVYEIVEPYRNHQTVWNEKNIIERTENLITEIIKIWSLS